MISIKVKSNIVRGSAQMLLDQQYDLMSAGQAILDPAIIRRLELIVSMMDDVDPDALVTIDEEAYAFLTQQ